MKPNRRSLRPAVICVSCLLISTALFQARAQSNPPIEGCNAGPQTYNVTVDVDEDGKLVYRSGDSDARTLHVCPADDVVWTGNQDDDSLTISFAKPGNNGTPGDDGQMLTSNQHRIQKHIKRRHKTLQYPYTVTLARGGMEYIEDPLIIIGH